MPTRSTHVDGKPAPGATVLVRAHDGRFLARASYSPVRRFARASGVSTKAEPIDHAFFKRRVQRAIAHRQTMVRDTGATRLIFGEADGLPGLIVDYYIADDESQRGQLVCQFMATGVEHWKEAIVAGADRRDRLPERLRTLGRVDPAEGRARTDHRRAGRRCAARPR